MIPFNKPFKKIELKKKYAYITRVDGKVIKCNMNQLGITLDYYMGEEHVPEHFPGKYYDR